MMHKRTLYSLLLISFMVVFAASFAVANTVVIEQKSNIPRCATQSNEVTINNSSNAAAVEIVLELSNGGTGAFATVTGIVLDAGFTAALPDFVIDMNGVDGASPDTIRITAMNLSGGSLAAGANLVGALEYSVSDDCDGQIAIDNVLEFEYPNPVGIITTQYVDDGAQLVALAVTSGYVHVANQDPVMNPVADGSVALGAVFSASASATDADLAGGCEALTYDVVSGPLGLTINASGLIQWSVPMDAVCNNPVTVKVVDGCNGEDETSFVITVLNNVPEITCPDNQMIGWGDTLTAAVVGTDADGTNLAYSIAGFDGPGIPMVDAATGAISWVTDYTSAYTGTFTLSIAVTDNFVVCDPSESNADTCSFEVQVVPFQITIEDYGPAIQGQEHIVDISMLNSGYVNYPMGGFDFLINYDASAMSLLGVDAGAFIEACGWEYFQYRYGPNGNCTGGCPSGVVRIVAMAESNDGTLFDGCYTNTPGTSNQLAQLRFLLSSDFNLECQYAPIRFVWYDCGDNTISSIYGDTLFVVEEVFDVAAGIYITDDGTSFPSFAGIAAEDSCLLGMAEKNMPWELIHFVNGGIRIICKDEIDDPGDLNLNGIAYEIADVVIFTNFFLKGLSAFGDETTEAGKLRIAASIAASDVNMDGLALSVADLVYLTRVVIGDALPYAKTNPVVASYSIDNGTISVDAEMGAAYVVVAGNQVPSLMATVMSMEFAFDGENTNILVSSIVPNASFSGEFLAVDGDIISIEMATFEGAPVTSKLVPKHFGLEQNYPNPFNPTATISFQLPTASEWTLTFYNVTGQLVETVDGFDAAGYVNYEWDASELASGVYFYKLEAGAFSATKKAVLLK